MPLREGLIGFAFRWKLRWFYHVHKTPLDNAGPRADGGGSAVMITREASAQDKCPQTTLMILRFVYEFRFRVRSRLFNTEMFVLKKQTGKD